jgi:hypothetical protein
MAMTTRSTDFWHVTSRIPLEVHRCVRGTHMPLCLLFLLAGRLFRLHFASECGDITFL